MDVHPPKNGIFIDIDPYPSIFVVIPSIIRILIMVIINPYEPLDD